MGRVAFSYFHTIRRSTTDKKVVYLRKKKTSKDKNKNTILRFTLRYYGATDGTSHHGANLEACHMTQPNDERSVGSRGTRALLDRLITWLFGTS